jgi:outer membrane lipopolysaccharide assembly protein LptE/RlpB
LRGSDIQTQVGSVYVRAAPHVDITDQLAHKLRASGVTVLNQSDTNAVTIDLLEQQQERRTVTTTVQAQAAEYRLELSVRYRIVGAGDVELVAERWARGSRVFPVDRNNLVGTSQEQSLMNDEIVGDLVAQILRSLAAATKNGGH